MRRFGWLDVVILTGCVAFFVGLVAPATNRTTEYAWAVKCHANLRQIGQGLILYAQANAGAFPRTRYDPATVAAPLAFTNPVAPDPFAEDGPRPNDVTASLYLLVRAGYVPLTAFRCPLNAAGRTPLPSIDDLASKSNFASPQWLTYGMANPFAAPAVAFRWNNRLSAEFPVAGDLNPGARALGAALDTPLARARRTGTLNHYAPNGQALLYGDGHVESLPTPLAGVQRDNVYTYGPVTGSSGGAGVVGPPAHANDAVLLPVASFDPGAIIDPYTRRRRFIVFLYVVWGTILASAAALVVVRIVQHRVVQRVGGAVVALSTAHRRERTGRCPACGYDLRATPERCPECGRGRDVMSG